MLDTVADRDPVIGSDRVVELLDRAIVEARRQRRVDLVERLVRERDRHSEHACHVLVVGEFKKGKSSLINALLNCRVCPVDADVATAYPTLVRYGSAGRAWAVFGAEDDEAERDPIEIDDIVDHATERALADPERPLRSLEVEVPRNLLHRGLVLVDTPGVGGGLGAAHAAATLRALTLADAVVFVSDASQEYTAAELDFLRCAHQLCPNVVTVLTKIDFFAEWRRILDIDRGHLQRAGFEPELFALSAPLRHRGLRSGDARMDEESGYPALTNWLVSAVLGDRERLVERSSAAALRSSLAQIERQLAAEHAPLADPGRTRELVERLERAKERSEHLRGGAARWQQTLNDRYGDMISNVDLDLAQRLRSIRREAVETINSTDPATVWSELEHWLYAQTNESMVSHYRHMRDEAEQVAAEVARHFADDSDGVTHELDLSEQVAPAESSLMVGALNFDKMGKGELGLVAVRGSATSMAIAGMIGTFAAVAVPILTPAAAVFAAVFGRKAIKAARESELRTRRADALRAVGTYLEETELVARKTSKDSLRRINQSLRAYFQDRAEEFHVSVSESLTAAARSVKLDRDEGDKRLQEVTAELQQVRALIAEVDAQLPHVDPVPSTAPAP